MRNLDNVCVVPAVDNMLSPATRGEKADAPHQSTAMTRKRGELDLCPEASWSASPGPFWTSLNGDKKTGQGFVLKKIFAADDRIRGGKRSRIAISSVDGHVGDDAFV